ncbi:MAG: PcfJ domain-containing protein, partial [bacterium]|nr:PcfJ domain-containing protein [bacterium]
MKRKDRETTKKNAEKERQMRSALKRLNIQNEEKKLANCTKYLLKTSLSKNKTPYDRLISHNDYKMAAQNLQDGLSDEQSQALIATWKPKGKGRDALFRSLAEHFYCKFPIPSFLWSVFFFNKASRFTDRFFNNNICLVNLVKHLAAGGSLYKAVQQKQLPVPLTRKMCHDFLQSDKSTSFLRALRKVQIQAVGGDKKLLDQWMLHDVSSMSSYEDECFWFSFLAWLAKNPMLESSQVAPIIDYIKYTRRERPDFSMKGRSALALLRSIEDWHRELGVVNAGTHIYIPSGIKGGKYTTTSKGGIITHWEIREILTEKDLAAEGRAQSHCVYSYKHAVADGATSIWSLRASDERALTIEVRHQLKKIVQVRGRFNRLATSLENNVLLLWA